MKLTQFLTIATLAAAASSHAAVVHTVVNGKLASASNVQVAGETYKVTFGDSCWGMYQGCTDASLFAFKNAVDAGVAFNALMAQVFVDNVMIGGVEYDFDSNNTLTKSCDYQSFCEIWIPYAIPSSSEAISLWGYNNSGASSDTVASNNYRIFNQYGEGATYMAFTRFEKMTAAAAVPEPATVALAGLALIGAAFARRKQTAAK